ncbi:leukocyte receptor cluster member 1 [Suricata suricatta]|uniref:Leukocyte receptor cluster member 1 n=1 Tax=Suricata suricatta TaxID=37032 RepID=A0A673UM54_SURSU|nr:leukocyte receptor cluster member 1 [Suricata suricatta]XP_029780578.1 leukocyte receptor cluster member 1 [Suricata suricatta]XP_029780579.1 leukocyte receptor cluster member 1 [Suricata suricatta]XP_029780580.1 leukocyte receptor cluster member 1 [Suricata suricatta]
MNILPKKSWHVRNKDNVARVRRDEAQAREEEKERERRVLLAQQEARTEFLRKKARHQNSLPELEAAEAGARTPGPVDLFRELLEEGKGVTRGNKEYEEEKRQEKERQEKALGILTYLGQSAAEAQTQPPWYQLPPGRGAPPPGPGPDEKIKNRLDPLREMQKHLKKKRRHSGDRDGDGHSRNGREGKQRPEARPSLDQLRAERLRREATERARAEALLARVRGAAPPEDQPAEETDERGRRYNSQFNPQWARRPASKTRVLTDSWGDRRGRGCQPSYKTIYS